MATSSSTRRLAGAAAWPTAARAQQTALPVIGILSESTAESVATTRLPAFMKGLKETGFVEGQNVSIEFRWANNEADRLSDLAADLVRRRVSLIVTMTTNLPARAAKSATTTIPIVFFMGADPVQLGVVASLSRPGGNVTGVSGLGIDLIQKRLQLLHELVPEAKAFGLLLNPDNLGPSSSAGRTQIELAENAVRVWSGTLQVAYTRTVGDFDAAFGGLAEKRIGALVAGADGLFNSGQERLVALAAQHAIPMAFVLREAVFTGGLMSYSANQADVMRQTGVYAGRILRGERPADLPVQQPTTFELVINLKTAKALGLTIPETLLATADQVIQ
jgi:putative tryptophan/tyrosine transport system substrate-binding protein